MRAPCRSKVVTACPGSAWPSVQSWKWPQRSRLPYAARRRALLEARTDLRNLDENQVAELLLGMIGDANRCDVPVDTEPFMPLGELKHDLIS